MSVFFDVPPPTPEEMAAKAEAQARAEKILAAARAGQGISAVGAEASEQAETDTTPPPKIESAATWEEAEALLPKDREGRRGQPDFTEAARRGIIRPRASEEGPRGETREAFKYDFFIPGNEPGYEAYFPHSTHTEWIACESCHPKIFPVRGTLKMTKDEIKDGKYCGVCHKKNDEGTAFWLRACDRCHLLTKD